MRMAVFFAVIFNLLTKKEASGINTGCITLNRFNRVFPSPIQFSSLDELIRQSKKAGEGAHGNVVIADYDNKKAAFKVIEPLTEDKKELTNNELFIYEKLKPLTEGVLSLLRCIADTNRMVLVLEARGASLRNFPSPIKYFTDEQKYLLVIKILTAVVSFNSMLIYHLDLHANNILYDEETDKVTIIDWGISCLEGAHIPTFNTKIMPPEMWRSEPWKVESFMPPAANKCGEYADVWAVLLLIGDIFMLNKRNILEGVPKRCFDIFFMPDCLIPIHDNIKQSLAADNAELAAYLINSLRYYQIERPQSNKQILKSFTQIYEEKFKRVYIKSLPLKKEKTQISEKFINITPVFSSRYPKEKNQEVMVINKKPAEGISFEVYQKQAHAPSAGNPHPVNNQLPLRTLRQPTYLDLLSGDNEKIKGSREELSHSTGALKDSLPQQVFPEKLLPPAGRPSFSSRVTELYLQRPFDRQQNEDGPSAEMPKNVEIPQRHISQKFINIEPPAAPVWGLKPTPIQDAAPAAKPSPASVKPPGLNLISAPARDSASGLEQAAGPAQAPTKITIRPSIATIKSRVRDHSENFNPFIDPFPETNRFNHQQLPNMSKWMHSRASEVRGINNGMLRASPHKHIISPNAPLSQRVHGRTPLGTTRLWQHWKVNPLSVEQLNDLIQQ